MRESGQGLTWTDDAGLWVMFPGQGEGSDEQVANAHLERDREPVDYVERWVLAAAFDVGEVGAVKVSYLRQPLFPTTARPVTRC